MFLSCLGLALLIGTKGKRASLTDRQVRQQNDKVLRFIHFVIICDGIRFWSAIKTALKLTKYL